MGGNIQEMSLHSLMSLYHSIRIFEIFFVALILSVCMRGA